MNIKSVSKIYSFKSIPYALKDGPGQSLALTIPSFQASLASHPASSLASFAASCLLV